MTGTEEGESYKVKEMESRKRMSILTTSIIIY